MIKTVLASVSDSKLELQSFLVNRQTKHLVSLWQWQKCTYFLSWSRFKSTGKSITCRLLKPVSQLTPPPKWPPCVNQSINQSNYFIVRLKV